MIKNIKNFADENPQKYFTEVLETCYGPEGSQKQHLHFKPGEDPYYPEGKEDDTHLSKKELWKCHDRPSRKSGSWNFPWPDSSDNEGHTQNNCRFSIVIGPASSSVK